MKKTKLMVFILSLVIGIFFLIPIKVNAITPDGTASDWYNFITQFEVGYASATVEFIEEWDADFFFAVIINDSPNNEFDDYYIQYDAEEIDDMQSYFEDILAVLIMGWLIWGNPEVNTLAEYIEQVEEEEDAVINFDGMIYWNFEEKYWQIDYYNTSEFNNKEVDMVTDLLDTLAEIGAGIGDLFGKIVESVGQFFYTPGTGDNPGSFTIIGILTIAAVVISLSMWVLRLILRLFKLRG